MTPLPMTPLQVASSAISEAFSGAPSDSSFNPLIFSDQREGSTLETGSSYLFKTQDIRVTVEKSFIAVNELDKDKWRLQLTISLVDYLVKSTISSINDIRKNHLSNMGCDLLGNRTIVTGSVLEKETYSNIRITIIFSKANPEIPLKDDIINTPLCSFSSPTDPMRFEETAEKVFKCAALSFAEFYSKRGTYRTCPEIHLRLKTSNVLNKYNFESLAPILTTCKSEVHELKKLFVQNKSDPKFCFYHRGTPKTTCTFETPERKTQNPSSNRVVVCNLSLRESASRQAMNRRFPAHFSIIRHYSPSQENSPLRFQHTSIPKIPDSRFVLATEPTENTPLTSPSTLPYIPNMTTSSSSSSSSSSSTHFWPSHSSSYSSPSSSYSPPSSSFVEFTFDHQKYALSHQSPSISPDLSTNEKALVITYVLGCIKNSENIQFTLTEEKKEPNPSFLIQCNCTLNERPKASFLRILKDGLAQLGLITALPLKSYDRTRYNEVISINKRQNTSFLISFLGPFQPRDIQINSLMGKIRTTITQKYPNLQALFSPFPVTVAEKKKFSSMVSITVHPVYNQQDIERQVRSVLQENGYDSSNTDKNNCSLVSKVHPKKNNILEISIYFKTPSSSSSASTPRRFQDKKELDIMKETVQELKNMLGNNSLFVIEPSNTESSSFTIVSNEINTNVSELRSATQTVLETTHGYTITTTPPRAGMVFAHKTAFVAPLLNSSSGIEIEVILYKPSQKSSPSTTTRLPFEIPDDPDIDLDGFSIPHPLPRRAIKQTPSSYANMIPSSPVPLVSPITDPRTPIEEDEKEFIICPDPRIPEIIPSGEYTVEEDLYGFNPEDFENYKKPPSDFDFLGTTTEEDPNYSLLGEELNDGFAVESFLTNSLQPGPDLKRPKSDDSTHENL